MHPLQYLVCKIPQTAEPGRLLSVGSQKVGLDWAHRHILEKAIISYFSSVTQSCLTLCDPMDCSMPGPPIHHQLLEFTQTHVHWVGDAIQPSHPWLSPSPPALNLSQHQGLFKRVSSLHQVTKILEFPKFQVGLTEYFLLSWNLFPGEVTKISSLNSNSLPVLDSNTVLRNLTVRNTLHLPSQARKRSSKHPKMSVTLRKTHLLRLTIHVLPGSARPLGRLIQNLHGNWTMYFSLDSHRCGRAGLTGSKAWKFYLLWQELVWVTFVHISLTRTSDMSVLNWKGARRCVWLRGG